MVEEKKKGSLEVLLDLQKKMTEQEKMIEELREEVKQLKDKPEEEPKEETEEEEEDDGLSI